MLVRTDSPLRTVADVIAAARSKPGLAYGSGGNGTTQHLSGALLEAVTGINLTHIPYRGGAPALQDLLSGTIPMMFDASSGVAGALKNRQVRGIAVTAAQRAKGFEDIPTFAEAGNTPEGSQYEAVLDRVQAEWEVAGLESLGGSHE